MKIHNPKRKPVDPAALKAYNRAKGELQASKGERPQSRAEIRRLRQIAHRLELAAVDRVKSFQITRD